MDSTDNFLHLARHRAHHRSKQRIQSFGEVWTPKKHVRHILDMLDKSVWTDTDVVFFEPTCGHGNFVEAVVQRRLNALWNKAKKQKIKEPHFYSAANTLNALWAVDIDPENIKICRNRVWFLVFRFLWTHERLRAPDAPQQDADERRSGPTKVSPPRFSPLRGAPLKAGSQRDGRLQKACPPEAGLSLKFFLKKHKGFLAHILCCIEWQIQENEALSCMESDPQKAVSAAAKTAVSRKWIQKNGHRPIDFEKTWLLRLETFKKKKIIPLEYKRNAKKLESLAQSKKLSVFEKNQETNQTNLLTFLNEQRARRARLSRSKESGADSDFYSFPTAA